MLSACPLHDLNIDARLLREWEVDFKHPPLLLFSIPSGSAWGAICSRGDLDPKNARPDGCYDAKIADLTMARERRALAVNGPTPGTGLGVFKWNDAFKNTFHWGTPDVYNFTFVEMKPIL